MTEDIRVATSGSVGHITLDRPTALNALTLDMVRAIDAALDRLLADEAIGTVLLDGAGPRGFCAGGDIRAMWESARTGGDLPARFLGAEYRLDLRLARLGKPLVTVMDGVTMGGGIGLGAHAAHRVVTERSVLAMPETAIGFLPDVGGTRLLALAPGETGTHLALTAGRMTGADAVALGFADLMLPSGGLSGLPMALDGVRTHDACRAALANYAVEPGASPLLAERGWIDAAYASDDVSTILAALNARPEPAAQEAAVAIRRNAPRSLVVTLRALREARRDPDLGACLAREYRLALDVTGAGDFVEGVRAAIVDKDRSPRWSPATLGEVDRAAVDRAFDPGDTPRLFARGV